jgi:hypothetical protein
MSNLVCLLIRERKVKIATPPVIFMPATSKGPGLWPMMVRKEPVPTAQRLESSSESTTFA